MTFVGMAGKDGTDEAQAFIDRHGLTNFETTFDTDGSVWGRYGITYQPAWVFVNDDGAATLIPGALGEERLAEELDKLVAN